MKGTSGALYNRGSQNMIVRIPCPYNPAVKVPRQFLCWGMLRLNLSLGCGVVMYWRAGLG